MPDLPGPTNPVIPMRRSRVWLVHGLIGFIAAGHLFEMVTGKEHWPFSEYPMFANLRRFRTLRELRLIGVTDEPASREIVLNHQRYLDPLDPVRLGATLARLQESERGRAEHFKDALAYVLDRYETLRARGAHHDPPLQRVELYRFAWRVDRQVRNIREPAERTLVATATRRRGGGA